MTLTNFEFYIIEPAEAINEVTNPSFELATTGYTAHGAGVTIARASIQQRHGTYSLEVTPASGVESGAYFDTVNEVSGAARTFSVDVLGVAGQAMRVQIRTTAGTVLSETTFTGTGYWQRIKVTRTGSASTTRRLYVVRDAAASTAKFYVDGFYYSTVDGTYLDGDMKGFIPGRQDYRWNGTPHASTSWRSGQTRSGGTMLRIKDYATILTFIGLGMANILNIAHPMTIDRSSYQTTRALDREFVLTLDFIGTHDQMQAQRQTIINAIRPDRVTVRQPLVLRYQGMDGSGAEASEPLDIYAHYVDGLENNPDHPYDEIAPVRFVSYLPFMAKAGDAGMVFGYQTAVTDFANIGYRDVDGQWKGMGTGANEEVKAIVISPDGSIYAGGNFTVIGGVTTRGIARWGGSSWNALGTGLANGLVNAIAIGPDGSLYIGGSFTQVGGVANTTYIAKWNGAAWSALSTGMESQVAALVFGQDGALYAGGYFLDAGGVANTAYIAKWNGTAWSALGTGMNSRVLAAAIGLDGALYVGGNFTTAGGVAANRTARFDGSAWSALGTGMNGEVRSMKFGPDGALYAGGSFTTASGAAVNYITKWNGSIWSSLGTGVDNNVYAVSVSPDGALYIGGGFTAASGLVLPDRGAVWHNGVWMPIDINVQNASATFSAFAFDNSGRVYLGGLWPGTTALSSTITVPNPGGVRAYPVVTITGPGKLHQLKNYTTGKAVYFSNFTLLAGETVTLDLRPGRFQMISDWRGNVAGYIAAGSDLDWFLQGGSNNVAVLMLSTTGATSTRMNWQDLYWSIDGAKR